MKNIKFSLMVTGLFLCAAALPALARGMSGEEKKLEVIAAELDKNHSEGQQRVADMIKAQFEVSDGLIMGLRFKKLGYGEIAIALSLAQDQHRIIKDEDLHKIVSLRQGPPVIGWGEIAKSLGLKLGPVINKVQKISAEVRKDEKGDQAKEDSKNEAEKARPQKKSWKERVRSFFK